MRESKLNPLYARYQYIYATLAVVLALNSALYHEITYENAHPYNERIHVLKGYVYIFNFIQIVLHRLR